MLNEHVQRNKFSNYKKMISTADAHWKIAELNKISNLDVTIESTNYLKDQHNRLFHHFCTTSYLGLDYHPALIVASLAKSFGASGGIVMFGNIEHKHKTIRQPYQNKATRKFHSHSTYSLWRGRSSDSSGLLSC